MVQALTNVARPGLHKVLVTGAVGFVGTALCHALAARAIKLRRVLRANNAFAPAHDDVVISDIGPSTAWQRALTGVDVVVHLAARTHVMRDSVPDPLAEYRRINVQATRALAEAAVNAGVRRFIFLSSIKVNGEQTTDQPFTETNAPRPEDAYGVSKWEAEQVLHKVAADAKLETVVLRPPLLYGPGVKGNFLSLIRAVDRGLPLPLGSVRNLRSLLYVGNLIEAILLCLDHPAAAGKTYLLADNAGVSTPDLVRGIGCALGKQARLLPFPPALLRLGGLATGKTAVVARLCGSLQIDSSLIRRELAWRPGCDMSEGLRATAGWYYGQLAGDT